jgi:hypothetical protein
MPPKRPSRRRGDAEQKPTHDALRRVSASTLSSPRSPPPGCSEPPASGAQLRSSPPARGPPDLAALGEAMRRHGLTPAEPVATLQSAIPSAEPPKRRSFMQASVSAKAALASAQDEGGASDGRAAGFRIVQAKRECDRDAASMRERRAAGSVSCCAIGRRLPCLSHQCPMPPVGVARPRPRPATTPDVRAATRDCATPPTRRPWKRSWREASDNPHGFRLRAPIVVLWRGGLRIQEALALGERDLDQRRGSLLVREGKGGRRREIGMDAWGWQQLQPWLAARVELPIGPLFCVIDGDPGRARTCVSSFADSPVKQRFGAVSRRTSCDTLTPSNSRAKACRSTSSSASSATPTSARPRSTCRASRPKRSSPRCTPAGRR